MDLITPKYQTLPSLKNIHSKRHHKKASLPPNNGNKLYINSPKYIKNSHPKYIGMPTSGKKNSHSITRFLFEKRNTFNNRYSKLKHNKSCEDAIRSGSSFRSGKRFFGDEYTYTQRYEGNVTARNNNSVSSNKNRKRFSKRKHTYENVKNLDSNGSGLNCNFNSTYTNKQNTNFYINASSPIIATRLDEKFKNMDDPIIDKNFEKDIDNDEIIVSNSNKKYSEIASAINDIDFKMIFNKRKPSQHSVSFSDDDNYEDNDYSNCKSQFDSLKNDFELVYTNDYICHIRNNMLKLELQLEIEKILEMQEAFHKEYKILKDKYYIIKHKFKTASDMYIHIDKRMHKLKQLQERIQIKNTMNTFITNHKLKQDKALAHINLNECDMWKTMLGLKLQNKFKKEKEFLLNILKKHICGSKSHLKLLTDVEQRICEQLCKRYFKMNYNTTSKKQKNGCTTQRKGSYNININVKSPVVRNLKYNHSNFIAQTPLSASSKNIKSNRLSSSGRRSFKTDLRIKKGN